MGKRDRTPTSKRNDTENERKLKEKIFTGKNRWKKKYNRNNWWIRTRTNEEARYKEAEDMIRRKKKQYAPISHWGSAIGKKPANTVCIVDNKLIGLRPWKFGNKKLESLRGYLRVTESGVGELQ